MARLLGELKTLPKCLNFITFSTFHKRCSISAALKLGISYNAVCSPSEDSDRHVHHHSLISLQGQPVDSQSPKCLQTDSED